MKIKVFGEDSIPEERTIHFRLKQCRENSISLQVVKSNGEKVWCGNLIHISVRDGGNVKFSLAAGVSDKEGLTLKNAQIIIRG